MTSNSIIHQDQWYQPKQLSAVSRQLRRWLRRLQSTALKARLYTNDMCWVLTLVLKTLMVTFTCFYVASRKANLGTKHNPIKVLGINRQQLHVLQTQ